MSETAPPDSPAGSPAGGTPLSVGKKILFTAIVTAVFALVVFSVAELYVRVTKPYLDLWVLTGRKAGESPMSTWASIDAFCAYRGKPGKYVSGKDIVKTIDSQGFISTPEIGFDKEPGELRIAFFGESSTAGTGKDLSDTDTWPWKTAELIRKRFPDRKVTFINAAMGGYTSFESFGRFWSRVRFFKPDIVVFNHGWNEMYYFNDIDVVKNWKVRPDGSWGLDDSVVQVCRPIALDHLFRYSQLLTRTRFSLAAGEGAEVGSEKGAKSGFDRRGLEIWRTNLRLIRDTAKSLDIPLFVCKQPTLVVAGLSKELQKKCHYSNHHFGHAAHVSAFNGVYSVIDQEIARSQIIDLTSISGKAELFFDHVHPTPKGTTEISTIVAQRLGDFAAQQALASTTRPTTAPATRPE